MKTAALRISIRQLQDPLTTNDSQWELCRYTGLDRKQIVETVVQSVDHTDPARWLATNLRINYNKVRCDGKYWVMLCFWMRMFIQQWRKKLDQVIDEGNKALTDPVAFDMESVIRNGALALNVDPDLLEHFMKNQAEIEVFLGAMRSTLGTLAEAKLWELVASGDAATIRWVLPRIKSDVFGDLPKNIEGDNVRNIRIIEE